ncbi:hypothetical protein HDV01_002184 [Terramyces sp. JEL0728]|nr:hypothetical protein HDV01_002184 [Terramyces sp. JEL0728]
MSNLSLIDDCISLSTKISEGIAGVKINCYQCKRLADRINILMYNLKESKLNENIPNYIPPLIEFQSCLVEILGLTEELTRNTWVVRAFNRNIDMETFSELNSRLSGCSQQLNLPSSQTIFSRDDDLDDLQQDIMLIEKEIDQIAKDESTDTESRPYKREFILRKLAARRNQLLNLEKPQLHIQVPKIPLNALNMKEMIGEGGFGQVYLAEWETQTVAVKKLNMKSMTKTQLGDFYRECNIMCNLRNSNTVLLQGIVEEKDTYMLVMEYMEGGSLFDLLHSSKEITWGDRGLFAYDIACGMAYLHKSGVVHCDLKSLNILLDIRDTCKICDFGLSKVKVNADSGIKTEKIDDACGSLRWKAPELFKPNAKFTKETDVFAFAIVLWEIAEREIPYGENFTDSQVVNYVVERGKRLELSPSCPKEIESIIQECWKPDPKIRPLFSTISIALSSYKPSKAGPLSNREKARERNQSVVSLKPNHSKKISQRTINSEALEEVSNSAELLGTRGIIVRGEAPPAYDSISTADRRIQNVKAKEFWIGNFGGNTLQVGWEDFYDCMINAFNNGKAVNEDCLKKLLADEKEMVRLNAFNRLTHKLEVFDSLFVPKENPSENVLSKDTLTASSNHLSLLPQEKKPEHEQTIKRGGSHMSLESVKSNFSGSVFKYFQNPVKKPEEQSQTNISDTKNSFVKGFTSNALEKVSTISSAAYNKANSAYDKAVQKADVLAANVYHQGVNVVTNPKDTVVKVGTNLISKIKFLGDTHKDALELPDSAISTEPPKLAEKVPKQNWQLKFKKETANVTMQINTSIGNFKEEVDSAIARLSGREDFGSIPNFEANEKPENPPRRPSISRRYLFEIKTKVEVVDKFVSNQIKETRKTLQKALTNVPEAPAQKPISNLQRYTEFLMGKKYYDAHNYKKSSEIFIVGIRNGSPECYLYLGMMFEDGLGVKNSPELAIQLYQRAVELGNIEGLYKAGMMYAGGKGVKKDLKEAARLLELCSKSGHPASITMLGNMYLDGNGVRRDCVKALELFKLTRGTTVGEYNMGIAYLKIRDYTNALDCFTNTAYEGFAPSQFQLARMYELGRGVDSNLKEAMYWYEKAAALGDQEATMNFNNLARIERKGLNPGKFTLDGTNCYLVGQGAHRILIDTGEGVPEFTEHFRKSIKEAGAEGISLILCTHSHKDHIGGIDQVQSLSNTKIPVYLFGSEGKYLNSTHAFNSLTDGQIFETDGATLKVIHTPGHTSDHVCFQLLEEDAIFAGDLILGRGTTIFDNLSEYMKSLHKVKKMDPKIIYPAHGEMIKDGPAKIQEYISHRQQREDEIIAHLSDGGQTSFELVEKIYVGYPQNILQAAEHSVILHLRKLIADDGGYTYEEMFGNALALEPSIRSKIKIITKCNIVINCPERPDVPNKYYDSSAQYIKWSVENSLKKIQTPYLDCLLIHRPDPLMNVDEMAEAFRELKAAGKVQSFGVSNFTTHQFELLQSRLDFSLVANQIELSVLHTPPLYDGTLDQMQRLRVRPMIWSPLAGGRLFTEKSERALCVVEALKKVAGEIGTGITIDQVAFAWILKHPSNPVIVVGTNDLKRLELNVKSQSLELSRPQWFAILEASEGKECP